MFKALGVYLLLLALRAGEKSVIGVFQCGGAAPEHPSLRLSE